ncbi:MAG: bifunctional N(6)-L-threonylcarbamoyladenine synthase/serine/threonine protein kinase [Candidatus Thermoplasmatota archaeon]
MIALGIESTAHTIGVGIVDSNCKILANETAVYISEKGGIHPREAANFHCQNVGKLIRKAKEKAGIQLGKVDIIAYSQGPGLGPCLRVGATAARTLSLILSKPIVPVNHCIAHLEIGRKICNVDDPVLLYVSGGNTQIISFARGRYRVFGETLDIGVGNLFDKFGREQNLQFPSGPQIEKLAEKGKKFVPLPYSVKGMDVSFSGILTACIALMKKERIEDICHSLQETVFSMLTEVSERAMAHLNKNKLLLAGGVASNKRLREMVKEMVEARDGKVFFPAYELCVDNGAMIAWTGLEMYRCGMQGNVKNATIKQRTRTDDVEVRWRNAF